MSFGNLNLILVLFDFENRTLNRREREPWDFNKLVPIKPPKEIRNSTVSKDLDPNRPTELQVNIMDKLHISANGTTALICVSLATTFIYLCQQFCAVCHCIVRRLNTRPRPAGDQR